MVARYGAGPEPIPHKKLNAENLAAALEFCQKPEVIQAAEKLGENMRRESGVRVCVRCVYVCVCCVCCVCVCVVLSVWGCVCVCVDV